jgi:hypothetical protein
MHTRFTKSSIHKNSGLSSRYPKEIWGIFLFAKLSLGVI